MFLKYCGFQRIEDVKQASQLGIDAIGMIHYPKSKRHQSIEQISEMCRHIPESIRRVVVIVNPTKEEIQNLLDNTSINTIQFHGHEDVSLLQWTKQKYPHIQIYKALHASNDLLPMIEKYQAYTDLFIVDTPSVQYGGTGKTFDWQLLKSIEGYPYLVAGGMSLENIKQFEATGIKALGFDLASGIETERFKDKQKMEAIANHIKGEKTI